MQWMCLCLMLYLISDTASIWLKNGNIRRHKRQARVKEEFLIYRYISSNSGFCLHATGQTNQDDMLIPTLSNECMFENVAARWTRLDGNLFKSSRLNRCLKAVPLEDGSLSGQLELSLCDFGNVLQRWKCDTSCNVGIQATLNYYNLDHALSVDGWTISGGEPVMRLPKRGNRNITSNNAPQWIIYDKAKSQLPRCICSAGLTSKMSVVKYSITTTIGGNVVGELCVFPYIYRGQEIWQCIRNQNGLHICATTGNLDRNKEKWGVCPGYKRGTFSVWLPPATCDKACGGGNIFKWRKCIFPPCRGNLQGKQVGETCNNHQCSGDRVFTVDGHSHLFPAYGVMTLLDNKIVGVCKFPFIADKRVSNVCLSDYRRSKLWCSLTDNYDKHQKWGYCVNETRGMWTSWVEQNIYHGSCSKSCGSGHTTRIRKCRMPPCDGESSMIGNPCNTQPCPECYHGSGISFRGNKNTVNDGTQCQNWDLQRPHRHPQEVRSVYPELQLNFCRNPGNRGSRPYCYRHSSDQPSKMYCDLYPCNTNLNVPGIPYTIPTSFDDNIQAPVPCIFPFSYQQEWFDSCFFLDENKVGREKCVVSTTGNTKTRYCPSYFRGRWSEWKLTGECSKSCGSGYRVKFRLCYLLPCIGRAVAVDRTKVCNTYPCTWNQPGSEQCFTGRGILYSGNSSKTVSGQSCSFWTDVADSLTRIHNDILPQGFPRLVKNYCRNPRPGAYFGPWCYISRRRNWEYCDAPRCPTCEGEIFGLPHFKFSGVRRSDGPCIFPFLGADNKWHNNCTREHPFLLTNQRMFCAFSLPHNYRQLERHPMNLDNLGSGRNRIKKKIFFRAAVLNGLKMGVYGVCPPSTRGTWTSWSVTEKCSAQCGGGWNVRYHQCLHPPCLTAATKLSSQVQSCNTHKCVNCLLGKGESYRGMVSQGYLGINCKSWSSLRKKFPPVSYPELTGRYCRNPGGFEPIPWCYPETTTSNVLEVMYCDIPHCSDKNLNTIPYTIPGRRGHVQYSKSGKACHFPFRYLNHWYHSCFRHSSGGRSQYVCSTTKLLANDVSTFALCPPHYKGHWTTWNKTDTCNKVCGGGKLLFVRECLYPPCNGSKYKFEESCNTCPCTWQRKQVENVDCFMGEGIAYVGNVDRTLDNRVCLPWWSTELNHKYAAEGAGMILQNKCRNPSLKGFRKAPWCFVAGSSTSQWEYCNIPRCQIHIGEIRTVGGPSDDRPCYFPFWSQGVKYGSCQTARIKTHSSGVISVQHFCATATNSDQNPSRGADKDWGICPPANTGTLSSWALRAGSSRCTAQCGGGKLKYYRRCRFKPCAIGVYYLKTSGRRCNTHPCQSSCFYGDGTTYKGKESFKFKEGRFECLKWNTLDIDRRRYERYRLLGNGDHNYCRNIAPSRYRMPFCFARVRSNYRGIVMCDMPRCGHRIDKLVTIGTDEEKGGKICVFPFRTNGKLVHSCQRHPQTNAYYCGIAIGRRDVLSERLFGFCSQHSIGTWSGWTRITQCSKPCGGGAYFHVRYCRYPPCSGKSKKEVGRCNTVACNQRQNCYSVGTRGVDFKSTSARFHLGVRCLPWSQYDASIYGNTIGCRNFKTIHSPRPVCPIRVRNGNSNKVSLHMCNVPPCPDSVIGPIMVMTKPVSGRSVSPCVFPFKFNGKNYYKCTNVPAPSSPEGRKVLSSRWCGTINILYADVKRFEWGYCPPEAQGMWNSWSSQTQEMSYACVLFQRRKCLFPPCVGNYWRIFSKYYEDLSCLPPAWGIWKSAIPCGQCDYIKIRYRDCINSRNFLRVDRSLCRGQPSDVKLCETDHSKVSKCRSVYVLGETSFSEVKELLSVYGSIRLIGSKNAADTLFHEDLYRKTFIPLIVTLLLYFDCPNSRFDHATFS